jgi:hypothetical protein
VVLSAVVSRGQRTSPRREKITGGFHPDFFGPDSKGPEPLSDKLRARADALDAQAKLRGQIARGTKYFDTGAAITIGTTLLNPFLGVAVTWVKDPFGENPRLFGIL